MISCSSWPDEEAQRYLWHTHTLSLSLTHTHTHTHTEFAVFAPPQQYPRSHRRSLLHEAPAGSAEGDAVRVAGSKASGRDGAEIPAGPAGEPVRLHQRWENNTTLHS